MKYFILRQDKDFTDAPKIINWYGAADKRKIAKGLSQEYPSLQLMEIEKSVHIDFIDILDNPFFLVRQEFMKMIKLYEPLTVFKQAALLDEENGLTELYHMPVLEKVDCLTEESEMNLDRSVVRKAVLDAKRIEDRSIFWLDGVSVTYTMARLDLVESVLRRGCRGIALEEAELVDE